ncbi:Putative LOC101237757, partial [Caligus rogercresseyi]
MDGSLIECLGEADVRLTVRDRTHSVRAIVSFNLISGVDVILGHDILRGYRILFDRGQLVLGACAEARREVEVVKGENFEVVFDGASWTARWQWKEEPRLRNRTSQYEVPGKLRGKFNEEVEKWVERGWLKPRAPNYGGLLPLMAVEHKRKGKVRPVLDFRELNEFVSCSGADADVCGDKLRSWRQFPENSALLDLKDAYMQIRVAGECSSAMRVQFRAEHFELTRVGFGLNCAPQIMKAVLSYVLSRDKDVSSATDHYYDDIIINLDKVCADRVKKLLVEYGLETKPMEKIDGTSVLGLDVFRAPNGRL